MPTLCLLKCVMSVPSCGLPPWSKHTMVYLAGLDRPKITSSRTVLGISQKFSDLTPNVRVYPTLVRLSFVGLCRRSSFKSVRLVDEVGN
jgi:hypothetical protein